MKTNFKHKSHNILYKSNKHTHRFEFINTFTLFQSFQMSYTYVCKSRVYTACMLTCYKMNIKWFFNILIETWKIHFYKLVD